MNLFVGEPVRKAPLDAITTAMGGSCGQAKVAQMLVCELGSQ